MERYGRQAITRSLFHFVLGKGVSAIAAFIVLVIAIRQLTSTEFAVYTSMHAMALMIGLLSSFGTNQVMMRFLPELRVRGNIVAMYRLLFRGIAVRGLTYAAVALLLYVYAEPICRAFEFDAWVEVVRLYCLVGFLRVNGTFIGAALESLLWQREAQYSAAVSGLVKVPLVLAAVWRGGMDLAGFVAIEIASELLLLLLVLGWAILRWKNDPERNLGDPEVLRRERSRYNRFSFWSYAQNLTSIGFGSASNRLFVSYFLPIDALARFGVIDRFIAFIWHYEPLRLFVGTVSTRSQLPIRRREGIRRRRRLGESAVPGESRRSGRPVRDLRGSRKHVVCVADGWQVRQSDDAVPRLFRGRDPGQCQQHRGHHCETG